MRTGLLLKVQKITQNLHFAHGECLLEREFQTFIEQSPKQELVSETRVTSNE